MMNMELTYGELKKIFPQNTLTLADDVTVSGISKDTRTLRPGNLYVAIRGDNFDGHDFVDQAFASGAKAVLVDRDLKITNSILVEDVTLALAKLASYYRDKFNQPLIAITGSSGKTTTKELLTHVLLGAGAVVATKGNLNNHIGVPLTIFEFNSAACFFVVEMGMNHLGEIDYLCRMAKPTHASITSIGRAHLEGVGGTLDGVAKAKGELFLGLSVGAKAFVLADEPRIVSMPTKADRVLFGFDAKATYGVSELFLKDDCTEFVMTEPRGRFVVRLPLIGRHHVQNAANVYAIASELGLSSELIVDRLGSFSIQSNRGKVLQRGLLKLIDDSYNANPDSMRAAIQAFQDRYADQRKILVLGAMRELGAGEVALHEEIGAFCKELGFENLLVIGDLGRYYLKGYYGDAIFDEGLVANSHQELARKLNVLAGKKEAVVLIKGSRSNHLEKIFEYL